MRITKFFTLLCAAATLFAACEPVDDNTNNPGGNTDKPGTGDQPTVTEITLTADKYVAVIGEVVSFTVTDSTGNNLTADSKVFNKATYTEVTNPFIPTEDGSLEFYAVYGTTISKTIKVDVVPGVPELPADSDPSNTSFNHRILLVDHTGTKCGWCPTMMKELRVVEADENYHNKFYEAMSHTYNSDDPSWSRSAEVVTSHYGSLVAGYPSLTFNFYYPRTADRSASDIMAQIDALWKAEGADAGITAAATGGNTQVVVKTGVKANVTGDYRVTAWLLEDGIYAPQAGTSDESYYTHNNSIRYIASSNPITGFDLGTIEAGQSAEYTMTLEISSSKWNKDNLKVLVIVSGLNDSNRYDVVNLAICPVNGSVEYDYMK